MKVRLFSLFSLSLAACFCIPANRYKAIRRSLKGDKEKSQHHQHVSITPKSALAILPPKKVIKALYDYQPSPENREELAFSKGDFFHVISREDDQHWYEACNPLFPNARGLVPVAFFEVIGKNQRDSGDSVHAPADLHHHHAHQQQHQQQQPRLAHDSGFSDSSTIVNSGSTHTTKTEKSSQFRMSSLGKTGATAMVYGIVMYDFNAERPDELEAKAGEAIIVIAQSNPEWFVAKPIGRLGGPGLIPVSFIEIRDMTTGKSAPDPLEAVRRAGVPRVEEWKKMTAEYKNSSISLGKFENGPQQAAAELERMSLNSRSNHQRSPSKHGYSQQPPQQPQQHYQVPIPVQASIPRYCFDNDKYWYIVEVQMEDGRWWELSRYYHDFYDFQIALLSQFEEEAGNRGGQRTLPFMPGPVTQVTNAISNGRRQSLDEYVKQLLAMPPHISRCQLVRQLFAPRPGDFEIDPTVMSDDYRLSSGSQQSSGHNLSRTASRQSSQGQMSGSNQQGHYQPSQRPTHQRSQGSVSQQYHQQPHQQMPPPGQQVQAPSMSRQGSSFNSQMPSQGSGAIKIKVFFQDDIIVIRVPDDINLRQLNDKLRDRLKVDSMVIRYKDEPSNSFVELLGDADLETAIRRNAKLMLYVSTP